ncbi:hypothetical protein VOM14_20920 [Paraburkholderia sp. MPAMCS5]|uniref:hypothetical protein n=1 Tax=Paraburkholderia sp. MPAMCS5 TaxID=3112563 RepID=UPI002E181E23|nr:hypothetical protein [Paraburkholderia sp. MPAMCS5]
MKRATLLIAVGLSAACVSSAAFAHADIGVFLGVPGPMYVAPPPVVYEPPPRVVYAPAYGYGYRYEDDDDDGHRWHHDHGWHRGWEHHHHHHDDDD